MGYTPVLVFYGSTAAAGALGDRSTGSRAVKGGNRDEQISRYGQCLSTRPGYFR